MSAMSRRGKGGHSKGGSGGGNGGAKKNRNGSSSGRKSVPRSAVYARAPKSGSVVAPAPGGGGRRP